MPSPRLALAALSFVLLLPGVASAGAPRKDEIPDAFQVDDQLQGDKFKDFRTFRGKVVIVDVMVLDRGELMDVCTKHAEELEKVWKDNKAKGLVVIGVAPDPRSKIQEFISKAKVTYPVLRSEEIARVYEIKTVPIDLLIAPTRRCASWGQLDGKQLGDLIGQVKPEDLKPQAPIDEVPKGDYSKKFDAVLKQLKNGELKQAAPALEKLEKEAGADGDNAKALTKWIHEYGQAKLEDGEELLRVEDFMAAKECYDDIEKRWPAADDVVKSAKDKIAGMKKDTDISNVLKQEKTWSQAQAAEKKGDKDKAIALYQKAADATTGTKFCQKCKDRIKALTPPPAPAPGK